MTGTGDPSPLWLKRPDVWAGTVLAAVAATRSFSPSLMPRRTGHQAIVSGVSAALGFALGGSVYGLAARTDSTGGDLAVLGGMGASGLALSKGLAERPGEPLWRPAMRSTGDLLAAGSVVAASGVLVRGSRRSFGAGAAVAGAAALVGARDVHRGLQAQRAMLETTDPPAPRPLPALTSSIGVASVLAGLANGYRHSGRAIAGVLQHRLGLRTLSSEVAGDVLAVGLWVGTAKALSNVFVTGMRLYDRVVDPGYDRPPVSPARSSGPGSPLSFARMGREGRRFVIDAPTLDEIAHVMGRPAVAEPVRVFVGYAHAHTDRTRVALAIDELRRTGAFERSLLVVGCPAGNGYVNTLPVEVLDHVLAGDVAAVAVQYGRLPSILTLNRVSRGGRVQRLLLEAIAAELADRPAARRPRLVVYGESLGAWAGQDTFLHQGVDGLDQLGVDRALWVGTPYYSGWRHEVLGAGTVSVPEGSVVEVESAADLAALGPDARRRLRAVVLGHDNDPVRYISATLLVQRPAWMGAERPPRVPAAMAFTPVTTTVEVLVDAINATRPIPGRFRATGHEYDGDLPEVVLDAYGIDRPDAETWTGLIDHLQAADARRATIAKALPEAESEVPEPPTATRRWPRDGSTPPRRHRAGGKGEKGGSGARGSRSQRRRSASRDR